MPTDDAARLDVGNDVIDLSVVTGASRHARFVRRVCSERERAALERSRAPAEALWWLWAAKESVFKRIQRRQPDAPFAHRLFEVELEHARVTYGGAVYGVAWQRRGHCLTCVSTDAPQRTLTGVQALASALDDPLEIAGRERVPGASEASLAVRKVAKRLLARALGRPAGLFEIVRAPKPARRGSRWLPPVVLLAGEPLPDVTLSLSHHGRFVACALATRRPDPPPRTPTEYR